MPRLVVIEHREDEHVTEHADRLRRLRDKAGAGTLHVTRAVWQEWLATVIESMDPSPRDETRFRRLLDPEGVAYSAGPNKAALIAAALGADVLHRRDSDLAVMDRSAGPAFPGVLESRAIGRSIEAVDPIANVDRVPTDERVGIVGFVGSAYWGDPPHDRRALLAIDPDFVVQIERLSSPNSSPEELRAEVEEYFVTEPALRYDDDFYEVDLTGRTELGVSCIVRIFLQLPEMPIADTLGCDYFQKNLLYQLGRPVLFHSRKMEHRYTDGDARRNDLRATTAYGLRDLRYLILWRVWSEHNRTIRSDPTRFVRADQQLDTDAYASSFDAALEQVQPSLASVPEGFARIHDDAAARSSGETRARLMAIAEAARHARDDVIEDVALGVSDFTWLTRRWSQLVDAATQVGSAALPLR